jgi:thymidylate synthase (FAD)
VIPSARLIALTQPYYAGDLGIEDPLDLIEYAGRWDYGAKSVEKMRTMGHGAIIGRWLAQGEESMIEMVDATFFIVCSRVVSHELVRHRLATYQQESQRFVDYEDEKAEDLFYLPDVKDIGAGGAVARYLHETLERYQSLRRLGVSKQLARYVLPNATRTRVIAKMNLRQWRHVLLLRMHPSAQPEMQEVARAIYFQLVELFPVIFQDIPDKIEAGREAR